MSLSKWGTAATALALLFFTGCADDANTDTDATTQADGAVDSDAQHAADSDHDHADDDHDHAHDGNNASEVAAKAPESKYLALPDGLPPRATQEYEQATAQAATGDAVALLNLASMSQQIGEQTGGDEAYEFFKQSATTLREGRAKYAEELPGAFVSPIFYNEACALARDGDVETASKSLEEAILSGFTDFDLVRTDSDLESVRAVDGFDDRLAEWESAAMAKIKEHAMEDLAGGETFPFEFALTDIDGNEQELAAYKGKVVIVDIWGTWCPPCREEIPSFIKLQEKFGEQGLQMLGLNYERGRSEEENVKLVVDYIASAGINYPCMMGDEETKAQVPGFRAFPTTMFIDRSGKVRLKAEGLHEYSYLEAIVSELLAEEAPADLNQAEPASEAAASDEEEKPMDEEKAATDDKAAEEKDATEEQKKSDDDQ